jgi:cell division ATPase FtsA
MNFLQKFSSALSMGKNEEYFLALDIGTFSAKAAIFKIELNAERKKTNAVILGAGKSLIKGENVREESFDELIESCLEAKKEAENMAGARARRVILGVSGQIVKVQTSQEVFERRDFSKAINLTEIKSIVQKVQWNALEKIRQQEKEESNISEKEIKIIGGRILETKIDGYKAVNPVGFQGKELSFNILNLYTFSSNLGFLKKLTKSFGGRLEMLTADSFAILNAVSDRIFNANNLGELSCFIIDCGGKITDVLLAHQGLISGPKTISLGGESLNKRLKNKLYLTEAESEKLKLEYSSGGLPEVIKQKVNEIIKSDLAVWRKGITVAVNDFSSLASLPSIILFSGGGSLFPEMTVALEDVAQKEKFNSSQPVNVRQLAANDIDRIIDRTNLLNGGEDIPILSLVNFGLNLTQRKTVLDSILNRVIRLM